MRGRTMELVELELSSNPLNLSNLLLNTDDLIAPTLIAVFDPLFVDKVDRHRAGDIYGSYWLWDRSILLYNEVAEETANNNL